MNKMTISKQVKQALKDCTITHNTLTPPARKLPAKVYADLKKAMIAAEGKWYGQVGQFIFPAHVNPTAIVAEITRSGSMTVRKQVYQEFFTPPVLADKMACCINEHFATSDPMPTHVSVLEPSAGRGALVEAILGCMGNPWAWNICACEKQALNADHIIKDPRVRVVEGDFLEQVSPVYPGVKNDGAAYDAIIMNPPFNGKTWLKHIQHALTFLRTNGVLVAVVPSSANLPDLDFIKDKSNVYITPVPFADFEDTDVKVSILTIGIPVAVVRAFFGKFQQEEVITPEVIDVGTPEEHIRAIRKELATMVRELDALERELRS